MMLRLEVREDNARAIRIYEQNGYRRIGREPDYYEDGATALRYEKTLRGDVPVATKVPFYQQTCEFTCGPCCLMMAMANFDPGFVPDPVMEIRLWREATTIFMMSGPGGCEPFGLAVAAHESGLSAEIYVSFYGALFLQSVRSEEKRRVMELAQVDFRRRAEHYGIPVNYRPFAHRRYPHRDRGGKACTCADQRFPDVRQEGSPLGARHRRRRRPYPDPRSLGRGRATGNHRWMPPTFPCPTPSS